MNISQKELLFLARAVVVISTIGAVRAYSEIRYYEGRIEARAETNESWINTLTLMKRSMKEEEA